MVRTNEGDHTRFAAEERSERGRGWGHRRQVFMGVVHMLGIPKGLLEDRLRIGSQGRSGARSSTGLVAEW